jgi:hypothetical protein
LESESDVESSTGDGGVDADNVSRCMIRLRLHLACLCRASDEETEDLAGA